jgi:hypothetical protein
MRSSRWLVLLAGAAMTVSAVLLPAEASAQRRVVRRAPRSVVYVATRPYRPIYYRPFYGYGYGGYPGWYSGWYGWPPYGYYGQIYPYPYGPYYRDYASEARLQVQPRHAEVFIDGYFVGTVDDFDGWSQRLRVEPGEHELEIYLSGYKTFRQPVLFRPGATIKIEHVMQPLAAGEQPEPRPTASPSTRSSPRRPGVGAEQARDPYAEPRRGTPPPSSVESREYGAIALRVQPMDAEVIVDGERWESPQAGDLTLQLSDGPHRLEIRKDGFRTYTAEIRVKRGETTSLNVSLSRQ